MNKQKPGQANTVIKRVTLAGTVSLLALLLLFLEFSELPRSTAIAAYEEEHLYPLYDAFEQDAARIRTFYNVLVNVTNGAFGTAALKTSAVVESVSNGQEVVERFFRTEPGYFDAILMDVQMPIMDSCEAARHIRGCDRADAERIPIIVTTANAFAEDMATVMAAGMNAHISKPLDIGALCSLLARLCGGTAALSKA